MSLWGVDLGGTKVEGVVLDDNCEVVARLRLETQAHLGYAHILRRISELLRQLEEESGQQRPMRIGVGTPGSARPDGTMKNCNTTCLNGMPLKADLETALESQVVLANDADCFALAESLMGSGRGYPTVFGVILGTGVGGGIVIDGRLLQGPNGLAGEWGHLVLRPGGHECYCGQRGCVEQYLSGPSVERQHRERTGESRSLRELAAATDPEAVETVQAFCQDFGASLSMVVNVLDPDVIVLGGGAGQVPQLRAQGLEELKRHVFGPDFVTPVVAPSLGDSAGVFGAAILARQ